ncbi:MAG: methyltransferase type 11 [uncultured bacterium]|nr:MAG: methyltransferase type 11 [uncultured bacterium]KKT02815.1 MAG: type 11 methyltransferase [Candidatus Peregrinibacteria bacterium GW2011_GWF2_43_17]KKT19492.1 MAG: Methyltransferase type 11 [Candidatus Peregrinibacteria bacterium GW2011_GWA2_43_8]HAU39677.1 hypothetical protein [Candidatus Peregrinibacteria bacterium]
MKDSTARELLNKVKYDYSNIAVDFDATRRCGWQDFEIFDKYLIENISVLDIGCGNGRLKEYLDKKTFVKYRGADNNQKFIDIAKRKGDFFDIGDFLSLPYPDSSFDLALSIAAFHHIPSRKLRLDALHEVKRIMKDGGRGVFLVWNLWQVRYFGLFMRVLLRFIFRFGKYGFCDFFVPWKATSGIVINRYYYAFSRRELEKLFTDAGFKVEKVGLTPSGNNYFVSFIK